MNIEELRISKLRDYMFEVINNLTTNRNYQINANMLSNSVDDYSIDKIPVQTEVMRWITGDEIHRDVYSLRSRKTYSQDTIVNLKNAGFFEQLEDAIKDNNEKGVLPDIKGIESIKCLNCGTLNVADTKSAIFDIQIEITYRYSQENGGDVSL